MASIQKIKNKYNCTINKKGIELFAIFEKQEDAVLWANYKEYLIEMIEVFDPPLKDIISLQDAIELKIKKLESETAKIKEINDYNNLYKYFRKFCSTPISNITYTDLLNHYEYLMTQPIIRGGTQNDDLTGHRKLPSKVTIFKKYAYLSTVYQMLISDGVDIENIAIKVCQFYKDKK